MQLKREVKFESDTDTEVIPKLLKYVYDDQKGKISFTEVSPTVCGKLQCVQSAAELLHVEGF